jgi:hypothetical protein
MSLYTSICIFASKDCTKQKRVCRNPHQNQHDAIDHQELSALFPHICHPIARQGTFLDTIPKLESCRDVPRLSCLLSIATLYAAQAGKTRLWRPTRGHSCNLSRRKLHRLGYLPYFYSHVVGPCPLSSPYKKKDTRIPTDSGCVLFRPISVRIDTLPLKTSPIYASPTTLAHNESEMDLLFMLFRRIALRTTIINSP